MSPRLRFVTALALAGAAPVAVGSAGGIAPGAGHATACGPSAGAGLSAGAMRCEQTAPVSAAGRATPPTAASATLGRSLFQGICQGCHPDGGYTAGVGPRLATRGLSGDRIRRMVLNGRGAMPGGLVSGSDLDAVVSYVRSIQGSTRRRPAPAVFRSADRRVECIAFVGAGGSAIRCTRLDTGLFGTVRRSRVTSGFRVPARRTARGRTLGPGRVRVFRLGDATYRCSGRDAATIRCASLGRRVAIIVAPDGVELLRPRVPKDPAAAAAGRLTFEGVCQGCHPDGGESAGVGPRLSSAGLSADDVRLIIEDGAGAMPGGLVAGGDLDNVVAYVRSIQ